MKGKFLITLIALSLLFGGIAQAYTLVDSGVTVTVDPVTGNVTGWYVGGGPYNLYQQDWFVGLPRAGQSVVNSTNFTLTSSSQPTPNSANFTFKNPGVFTVDESYNLLGGDPSSDLAEQFRLTNTSGHAIAFRVYLYTDFDLAGIPPGDTATMTNASAIQTGKGYNQQTGVAPFASHEEVNFWPNTLNSLTGGAAYTLNGVLGPLGPGDMTYAFEWDFTLNNGADFAVSADKQLTVIPMPSTLLLLGSGLVGLLGMRRVRKG